MKQGKKMSKGRFLTALVVTFGVIVAILPFVVSAVVEYVLSAKIAEYGLFPDVRMSLGYCWRNGPGIEGDLKVSIIDTPWSVSSEFGASCCEWFAAVHVPKIRFRESDPTVETLLRHFPVPAVSNLVFSGTLSLEAKAERTFSMPVPVWSVKLPLEDVSTSFVANDTPYDLATLRVTLGVKGVADRIDTQPMFLRAQSARAGEFAFTNFTASVYMTERALVVTEAGAGFCDGDVRLYSLFLDRKNLSAGFTVFVDDIDAGRALAHVKGFHGEASGRLHGKIKLRLRNGGKHLRLGDAFLYSTPGETGNLRIEDATPVTDNLALAGLDDATRANVSNALSDLDYSVLRLNLRRTDGDNATLSVTLRGTASRGKVSAPVDLTLNFNGALEQLVNTGLGYSALRKGKKQ